MATGWSVPAVIDYLVSTLGAALTPVPVIDGEGVSDDQDHTYVLVGVTDPDNVDYDAAADTQLEYNALQHGVNPMNETSAVYVTVVNADGGQNPKTARDGAKSIVNQVLTTVRGDPTLGSNVLYASVQRVTLKQAQNDWGAVAEVTITVMFAARIT